MVFSSSICPPVLADEERFSISIRSGFAISSHELISEKFGNGYGFSINGGTRKSNVGYDIDLGYIIYPDRNYYGTDIAYISLTNNYLRIYYSRLTLRTFLSSQNSKSNIYFGMGGGFYYTDWKERHLYRGDSLDNFYYYLDKETRKSTLGWGVHFLTGFKVNIYHNIYLASEIAFTYIPADIDLTTRYQYEDRSFSFRHEHNSINLGGKEFGLAIAYHF